ncbi:hypothetical protein CRYUN_Cryun01aG0138800 [Craigia yunnanensis]
MKNPIKPFIHCLLCVFIFLLDKVVVTQNTTIPVNVGVVLDLDSLVGKIGLSCINMALSDFYETHGDYKTRLVLNTRDSNEDVVGAAAAALDLIKNVEVQAIIGPTTSMQANFVINLGNKSQVPIITFSATSPSLTSLESSYFFRAAQSSSSQVKAISAIVKAFGWRVAVPIYEDNQFGESIIPYLSEALQEINARIPYLSVISLSATDDQIAGELYKLMAMQTRVFIVHMTMRLGSRLLTKAKEIGMMSEGYAWILTDGITTHWTSTDSSTIDSMLGVLGVRTYIPKLKRLETFKVRWKRKLQQENPDIIDAELNILGLRAYDATFALALAIEKAGSSNFRFNKTNVSGRAVDLESFGVSQNGPQLIQVLSSIKFRGLTGDYHFVNGQLNSSVFHIVNVNGNGERTVGFWTPENGLVSRLNLENRKTSINSSFKPNLGPIIWPGDTTIVPLGWDIARNGSKLRIGVPVNDGFSDFVQVTWDPISQKATSIKGYCIDVFAAVMAKMAYAVPYEFIPFATPDRKSAGSYNELIDQVYYGNYDAVVGDTTIVANRSLYVDFTLPYTDSRKKNTWVFVKPLTWDLWVTSGCFFVFIGFVVWVLEHRINKDFRGPPAHQVGTMFWFSLSTMVFAHRERVVSNLVRFVIIIWCFVVLILTQFYTASLTSLLTIEQLQPTVTDISELLKRKESSLEELHELFAKGSANGGISAALDEFHLLSSFLQNFAVNIPRGSHLVEDVSRAILNVTQGDDMNQIEDTWFKKETVCLDRNSISSNSLGLESFRGLFLIAGTASLLALVIFVAMFLYEPRHVLLQFDSETSTWRRIRTMLRFFDQKDLSSHTFKNCQHREGSYVASVQRIGFVGGSPNTNCPPSPSSCSNQTNSSEFVFIVEQGRPPEHVDLTPSDSASPEIFPSPERSIELAN